MGGSSVVQLLSGTEITATTVRAAKGQILFQPGEPADHLYLLRAGTVKLYDVTAEHVATLYRVAGRGDWIGWTALAPNQTRITRAVAAEPCELSRLSAQSVMALAARHPQVLAELFKEFVVQSRRAHEEVFMSHRRSADVRVVRTLLWLSESAVAEQVNGWSILDLTHQELAELVGLARETVTTLLGQLKRAAMLSTRRGRIVVDAKALAQLAIELGRTTGKQELASILPRRSAAA